MTQSDLTLIGGAGSIVGWLIGWSVFVCVGWGDTQYNRYHFYGADKTAEQYKLYGGRR